MGFNFRRSENRNFISGTTAILDNSQLFGLQNTIRHTFSESIKTPSEPKKSNLFSGVKKAYKKGVESFRDITINYTLLGFKKLNNQRIDLSYRVLNKLKLNSLLKDPKIFPDFYENFGIRNQKISTALKYLKEFKLEKRNLKQEKRIVNRIYRKDVKNGCTNLFEFPQYKQERLDNLEKKLIVIKSELKFQRSQKELSFYDRVLKSKGYFTAESRKEKITIKKDLDNELVNRINEAVIKLKKEDNTKERHLKYFSRSRFGGGMKDAWDRETGIISKIGSVSSQFIESYAHPLTRKYLNSLGIDRLRTLLRESLKEKLDPCQRVDLIKILEKNVYTSNDKKWKLIRDRCMIGVKGAMLVSSFFLAYSAFMVNFLAPPKNAPIYTKRCTFFERVVDLKEAHRHLNGKFVEPFKIPERIKNMDVRFIDEKTGEPNLFDKTIGKALSFVQFKTYVPEKPLEILNLTSGVDSKRTGMTVKDSSDELMYYQPNMHESVDKPNTFFGKMLSVMEDRQMLDYIYGTDMSLIFKDTVFKFIRTNVFKKVTAFRNYISGRGSTANSSMTDQDMKKFFFVSDNVEKTRQLRKYKKPLQSRKSRSLVRKFQEILLGLKFAYYHEPKEAFITYQRDSLTFGARFFGEREGVSSASRSFFGDQLPQIENLEEILKDDKNGLKKAGKIVKRFAFLASAGPKPKSLEIWARYELGAKFRKKYGFLTHSQFVKYSGWRRKGTKTVEEFNNKQFKRLLRERKIAKRMHWVSDDKFLRWDHFSRILKDKLKSYSKFSPKKNSLYIWGSKAETIIDEQKKRVNNVLDKNLIVGVINPKIYRAAWKHKLKFKGAKIINKVNAPFRLLKNELVKLSGYKKGDKFKLQNRGIKVKTTYHMDVIKRVKKIFDARIKTLYLRDKYIMSHHKFKSDPKLANYGVLILKVPDDGGPAKYIAAVGNRSVDFYDWGHKRATSLRKLNWKTGSVHVVKDKIKEKTALGSLIKPLMFALSQEKMLDDSPKMRKEIHLASTFKDVKRTFEYKFGRRTKFYTPQNYDLWFSKASIPYWKGIAMSKNSCGTSLVKLLGVDYVKKGIENLLERKLDKNLSSSIALGTSEASMTEVIRAFSVIYNGGLDRGTTSIDELKIMGSTYHLKNPEILQVMDEKSAFVTKVAMYDVVKEGLGRGAYRKGQCRGAKTGTSSLPGGGDKEIMAVLMITSKKGNYILLARLGKENKDLNRSVFRNGNYVPVSYRTYKRLKRHSGGRVTSSDIAADLGKVADYLVTDKDLGEENYLKQHTPDGVKWCKTKWNNKIIEKPKINSFKRHEIFSRKFVDLDKKKKEIQERNRRDYGLIKKPEYKRKKIIDKLASIAQIFN